MCLAWSRVDGCPVGRFAPTSRAADAGLLGGDDVFTQPETAGDGAGRLGRDVVAAAAPGFCDELVAPELAEVIGGLTDGVTGPGADGVDLGGQVGDAEARGAAASAAKRPTRAVRIRALSESMPPTRVRPVTDGWGSSSEMHTRMKYGGVEKIKEMVQKHPRASRQDGPRGCRGSGPGQRPPRQGFGVVADRPRTAARARPRCSPSGSQPAEIGP